MIPLDRIQQLLDKYYELIRLETCEFFVNATEVRHLLGRLGEFYCALQIGGTLAHLTNQPGFDVICSAGRKVSVKTTAQKSGFIPIGKSTIHRADDLMIVQYKEELLTTTYYGTVEKALSAARYYERSGNYELEISKARRLMAVSES
ncbi:DUF6998 domain-containing protein [Pseudomonas sp. zjy_14]|uniref:DUF6998 domain-containing protein n=1 Tax=Pseudomonas sp. zjy_14 TaxID=3367264 RepID=UPI00370A8AE2